MVKASESMAEVVRGVVPLLKEAGFRKRHNVFNRTTEPGVVQVLAFQLGRKDLAGSFTVNLGVRVDEVDRLRFGVEPPGWATKGHATERLDWWSLDDPGTIGEAIRDRALPWLDGRRTRDDLLRLSGSDRWSTLDAMAILVERGERAEAERLLADYLATDPHALHVQNLRDVVLPRMGLRAP